MAARLRVNLTTPAAISKQCEERRSITFVDTMVAEDRISQPGGPDNTGYL